MDQLNPCRNRCSVRSLAIKREMSPFFPFLAAWRCLTHRKFLFCFIVDVGASTQSPPRLRSGRSSRRLPPKHRLFGLQIFRERASVYFLPVKALYPHTDGHKHRLEYQPAKAAGSRDVADPRGLQQLLLGALAWVYGTSLCSTIAVSCKCARSHKDVARKSRVHLRLYVA